MIFHPILKRLVRSGTLTVRYPDGITHIYGNGAEPTAGFVLHTRLAEVQMVLDPSLALGELYVSGELEPLDCGCFEILDLFLHNLFTGHVHPMETAMRLLRRVRRRIDQFNPAQRAQRNVAHHYDLDERLYALFLDRDRQYSCAYFPTGAETLEQAQAAKKRHIAAKLHLVRPGLEVLDIGCGWGGMALTLAREYGARVTGVTLSGEQLAVARQRAREAGLEDRVRFELMDYRAWQRPVDRIVSVGMFEHVGLNHYASFFRAVQGALRPDGVALVHAIGRAGGPGTTNPFLAKYIFPGGYAPALSEVLPAVERSGLWVTDIEVLRLHYAQTLRHWRARFAANRARVAALYDERFCRIFEFYLAGSEVAFRRTDHMVWQMQLTRSRDALPTRGAITEDQPYSAVSWAELSA